MLSNITWTEFLTGVFLMVCIYYLYVVFRYYPEKLKALLGARKAPAVERAAFLADPKEEGPEVPAEEPEAQTGHSDLDDVEELVNRLTETIASCSAKEIVAGEFKQALGMVLRSSPALRNSPYRPSINELVVSECGKHGTFTLSEQEVDWLWEK